MFTMTDISKCEGWPYKICQTCYRKLAPLGGHQSYISGRISKSGIRCEDYLEVKSKSEMKRIAIQKGEKMW